MKMKNIMNYIRMKKSFIFIFLFLPIMIFANEISIEAGWTPAATVAIYPTDVIFIDYSNACYVKIDARLEYAFLWFEGGLQVYAFPMLPQFYPFYIGSWVGVGLKWKSLALGYEHTCFHPITPLFYMMDPLIHQDGAYDVVFLRYTLQF